jgi:hypothetical protein
MEGDSKTGRTEMSHPHCSILKGRKHAAVQTSSHVDTAWLAFCFGIFFGPI